MSALKILLDSIRQYAIFTKKKRISAMAAVTSIFHIARYTLQDELRHRRVYLLGAVSVLCVLALRGCFKSEFVFNGAAISKAQTGWYVSIIGFQLVSWGGMLLAALLAARALRRDRDDGTASYILSKPCGRLEYLAGKTAGLWVLCYGLTFLLHGTLFVLMILNTGGRMPLYMGASIISSVNILFVIVAAMTLASVLPEALAALCVIGTGALSLLFDTLFAAGRSVALTMTDAGNTGVVRAFWPKIASLQYWCTSLMKGQDNFTFPGPVHPFVNVLAYCAFLTVILAIRFKNEEIA